MMINDCNSALNYSARYNARVTIPSQRGDTKANARSTPENLGKGKGSSTARRLQKPQESPPSKEKMRPHC